MPGKLRGAKRPKQLSWPGEHATSPAGRSVSSRILVVIRNRRLQSALRWRPDRRLLPDAAVGAAGSLIRALPGWRLSRRMTSERRVLHAWLLMLLLLLLLSVSLPPTPQSTTASDPFNVHTFRSDYAPVHCCRMNCDLLSDPSTSPLETRVYNYSRVQ